MKLLLEGIEEITSFLIEHYQNREVNMVLMNHNIMVNEDVLVLTELLTTLEEVEVVLANYEMVSNKRGEADEDFLSAAVRLYGANTAGKPENDNSPVLTLPADEEATAEVQDGVLTIHGQHGMLLQIVPLDVIPEDYAHDVMERADLS